MKKIVVVGGGTMGLDIAHTFARSGHAVVVREISDELAEKYAERFRWPEMFMRTVDGHVLWVRLAPGETPHIIA